MDVRARLERARSRLDLPVLGRIAQSAIAAGAAWELALLIPGHGQPFFAPIAAVIALGADRGRRGRQAIEMMIGVALGILLGAGLLALVGAGGWQIVLATAIAFTVSTAVGASPLTRIQAAASAILVVALHRSGANVAAERLIDALIGGGIAIVLASLLFPVDPLELVRDEARTLRSRVADALDELAGALETNDRARAEAALAAIDSIDDGRLDDALALARDVVRRAPRRRPLRRRIEALSVAWHELDSSVSDAYAIATGALRVLNSDLPPSAEHVRAVAAAAAAVRTIDQTESREAAERAREAAEALLAVDNSLGASVIAHGVVAVADHALRAADARDEDSKLASQTRNRFRGLRVGSKSKR